MATVAKRTTWTTAVFARTRKTQLLALNDFYSFPAMYKTAPNSAASQ